MLAEKLTNLCKNISRRGSEIFYFSKCFQDCKVTSFSNMFVTKEIEKFHVEIQMLSWKEYSVLKHEGKTFLIFRSDISQFSNLEFCKKTEFSEETFSLDCIDASIQLEISLFTAEIEGEVSSYIDYHFYIVNSDFLNRDISLSTKEKVEWKMNKPIIEFVL